MKIDLFKLCCSFKNAYKGLIYAVSQEQNLQIELIASATIVLTMIVLRVERWEAVVLVFSIFVVLILEMLNTIIERLMNILKPRIHPYIRTIKDMMAAIVFLASLGATLVGILVFWPYIFR